MSKPLPDENLMGVPSRIELDLYFRYYCNRIENYKMSCLRDLINIFNVV
jgi:hypothetical protein